MKNLKFGLLTVCGSLLLSGRRIQQYDEFVPTEPCYQINLRQAVTQSCSQTAKDPVAFYVTQRIVNDFKMVQVNKQYSQLALICLFGSLHRRPQSIYKEPAIEKIG